MREQLLLVFLLLFFGCKPSKYLQNDAVKLSPPIIFCNHVLFEGSTEVKISSTAENAKVQYSINGNKFTTYNGPFDITEPATIKARATGGGYVTSDETALEVRPLTKLEIISITSSRVLDDKYGEGGLKLLMDRKKGSADFNEGWLGYSGGSVIFDLVFDEYTVKQVVLSTLRKQGAWIFDPYKINIYSNDQLIGSSTIMDAEKEKKDGEQFAVIEVKSEAVTSLKIEVLTLNEVPDWHAAKGNNPWLFIDEILVY